MRLSERELRLNFLLSNCHLIHVCSKSIWLDIWVLLSNIWKRRSPLHWFVLNVVLLGVVLSGAVNIDIFLLICLHKCFCSVGVQLDCCCHAWVGILIQIIIISIALNSRKYCSYKYGGGVFLSTKHKISNLYYLPRFSFSVNWIWC